MEMSLSRALGELKMLAKRIEKVNDELMPIDMVINKKCAIGKSTDDFVNSARADNQSSKDLTKRYNTIKTALILANATTDVFIAGIKYTIAGVIERKNSIAFDKGRLFRLRKVLAETRTAIVRHNERALMNCDKSAGEVLGKESVAIKDGQYTTFYNQYMGTHEASMIDPINIEKEIKDLEDEINAFEMEVDISLSEANARTMITIPD